MFSKNIKKYLVLTILFVGCLTATMTSTIQSVSAEKNIGDDLKSLVNGMFTSTDTGVVSFTDVNLKGGIRAPTPEGYDSSLTQVKSGREFVVKVVNYALGFLGLFAVLMVIYGGFLYLSSAGESDGPEKGKKTIMYAVIGIIIIMGSYAIVNTVLKAPGGNQAAQSADTAGAGVPAQVGKNSQAARVYNLAYYVLNAYQNYAASKVALQGIGESIDTLWKDAAMNSEGDALDAVNQIQTNYNTMAGTIQSIASRSGEFTTLTDMLQYQQLYVKKWLDDRRSEISKVQNTPVNAGTLTDPNLDTKPIPGVESVTNCNADSPLTSPTDAQCIQGRFEQYYAEFKKNYTALTTYLKKESEQKVKFTPDTSAGDPTINNSIGSMKTQLGFDFASAMDHAQKELIAIYGSAASSTDVQNYFKSQFNLTGTVKDDGKTTIAIFQNLKLEKDNVVKSKEDLQKAVEGIATLYEMLKDLQGVTVKLTANIKEGNAPLIVNFSTVGSTDPSNKSIIDNNISWDLDGNGKFDGTDNTICGTEEKQKKATVTCVYTKPGTYRVAVNITSQSDNTVGGTQYLDIRVNPPRARFSIKLKAKNSPSAIPMTLYDANGIVVIDRTKVQLAWSEAQNGVTFDATGTTSGDINANDKTSDVDKTTNSIQRIRWTFGDGTSSDDSLATKDLNTSMSNEHKYAKRGTYQVMLEVTGKDGVVDRKIFFITIADISAIIEVKPGYINKVNTPLTFDSAVTSDGSKITYEWSSTPDNPKLKSDQPTFSAAPDKPGHYNITLKVKSVSSNNEASDSVDVSIESAPPIAKFSTKTPKATQPAEVELDGSGTYDPDSENTKILYYWTIPGELGKDYIYTVGTGSEKIIRVKFLTVGERKIELKVEDDAEKGKTTKATQSVTINSLLDGDWTPTTDASAILAEDGTATVALGIASTHGTSYTFDYGDGEVEDGVFTKTQVAQTKHIFKKAGVFSISATIQDDQNGKIKLTKKISIGAGKNPIAVTKVLLNNEEIDTTEQTNASRKDVFTFSASDSKNTDGTAKNLDYSWDFGDGKKSTKPSINYSFKDLSPKVPGYYLVTLTISDHTDPTKKATESFKINIVTQKPTLKTITVIPLAAEYKTPLKVQLKAVDAKAPEGQITTYRWWYYDVKDNTNELGSQITTGPETTLTLGTKGEEGQEVEYAFQVELRDNMNQTATAADILGEENLPTLKVVNGPNKPPKASFTVSKTSVQTGEDVTFTSTSTDSDGTIKNYIWDVDGDGFQNDESMIKTSITKTYTTAASQGIKVRLKVVDDSYAESTSDPVTIYVTSKYAAPKPAFYYQQKEGTLQVAFQNASTIDKELTLGSSVWDFDTASNLKSADSNNDGSKNNDSDSQEKSPTNIYDAAGTYYVKLTVKDSSGGEASVTSPVVVKPLSAGQGGGSAPAFGTPAFGAPAGASSPASQKPLSAKMNTVPAVDPVDGKIHLTGTGGNVTIDFSPSEGAITKYVIDKNIYFDSNNDKINDNDENYTITTPGQWTTDFQKAYGKIGIKLTVYDATGKSSSITREVIFDNTLASGANNIFVIPGAYELYGGFASMFGFGILSYRNKKRKNKNA